MNNALEAALANILRQILLPPSSTMLCSLVGITTSFVGVAE